jgi:hypothetical protein
MEKQKMEIKDGNDYFGSLACGNQLVIISEQIAMK